MDKFDFEFNGENVVIEVLKVIRMKTKNKIRFRVAMETYGSFECEFWLKNKHTTKGGGGYRFYWADTPLASSYENMQLPFMCELRAKATRFFVERIMKDCFGGWEDEEVLLGILRRVFIRAYIWEQEKGKN